MKGLEIKFNEKTFFINEDELTSVLVENVVGKGAFVHVSNVNYTAQERNVWQEFTPIEPGATLKIKLTDIDGRTPPTSSVHDAGLKNPMPSKLEYFRQLEEILKKKGLL